MSIDEKIAHWHMPPVWSGNGTWATKRCFCPCSMDLTSISGYHTRMICARDATACYRVHSSKETITLGSVGKPRRRPESEQFFSPGKDGEAGDIGFIVDGAPDVHRDSRAEEGPLEARSSFQTEPAAGHSTCAYPRGARKSGSSGR